MNQTNRLALLAAAATFMVMLSACGASGDSESDTASSGTVADGSSSPPTTSGYVDLLDAEIRGLDAETVEGFLTGEGLGYALPAELNGYPGPRHVLDMVDELELSGDQHAQIQELFDQMRADAIPLGEQIVAAEAALESAFRTGEIDDDALGSSLDAIGVLDADLRFVHLSAHLATIDVLTEQQVDLYNDLRGYGHADQGHDHMSEDHDQHQRG